MAVLNDLIVQGPSRLIGDAQGTKFIVDGATSSQFLKGDGTLDSTSYATAAGYVPTGRTISTASGLTGGGNLSANRTIGLVATGTSGTYGPTANVTGSNNATIKVPQITTDAYGRVTAVTERTYTSVDHTYTVNNGTFAISGNGTSVASTSANASANSGLNIKSGSNVTITTGANEITIAATNTDTKVTAVGNHYTPTSSTTKTAAASGGNALGWSASIISGVTLNVDAAGHVTNVGVSSAKLPANPNTDTKVTSVANHYVITATSADTKSASANGGSALAWSSSIVTGVTLSGDARGHITSVTVASAKLPANPNTDTKVTAVGNHYTPTSSTTKTAAASGGNALGWGASIISGVTLNVDAAGHVTNVGVSSAKLPANPNTDVNVAQAPTSDNNNYEVLFSKSANNTAETGTTRKDTKLTFNPSVGRLGTVAINHLITGSGTAATTGTSGTSTVYYPAKWTFNKSIVPKDGDSYLIKVPVAGHDYGTFISLNNGTNYYPVALAGATRLGGQYPVNNYINVVFESGGTVNSVFPLSGGTARVNVTTGGIFRAVNFYDTNSTDIAYTYQYCGYYKPAQALNRYMLCFRKNETTVIPASTTNNTTANTKTINTDEFDPFGGIYYFSSAGTVATTAVIPNATLHDGYALDLRYSFNVANVLTQYKEVYVVAEPQSNGKAKFRNPTTTGVTNSPITQTLPTTDDGYIYIYLGMAYSTTSVSLSRTHPVYQYKNGAIRCYTNTGGFNKLTNPTASTKVGLVNSLSEYYDTNIGKCAVIEGSGEESDDNYIIASGDYSHAEGYETSATSEASHAEGYQTVASGSSSHAEGSGTIASGDDSHAEGSDTTASGYASHAEGDSTIASGKYSHAEGDSTTASGLRSHAEGNTTTASGNSSHAEGRKTKAIGNYSHAEGENTVASGNTSHAEGSSTTAVTINSHAEGEYTIASGTSSHAEGSHTTASGYASHAEGDSTIASGKYSHAEGQTARAYGNYSHAEGYYTTASGNASHAEGDSTKASGTSSHAEGYNTSAMTNSSHAEGQGTTASGGQSHAEGQGTEAYGSWSHAEGYTTIASGNCSHAEGSNTTANGFASHAEGQNTKASGDRSHAEGLSTSATSEASHAEGSGTTASGQYSHAEGSGTTASGKYSHAEGASTIAKNQSEHASGQYNVSSSASTTFGNSGNTLFSVGNGTSTTNRKNAFEIRQNGLSYMNGNVQVSGTVSQVSDERLKNIIEDKELLLEEIVNAPLVSYTFKGVENDSPHIGTIAQYWLDILPEVVCEYDSEEKNLSLDYSSLNVAIGISLAKIVKNEIDSLKKEITLLKQNIGKIE